MPSRFPKSGADQPIWLDLVQASEAERAEAEAAFGYQYGLAMIVISAVVPLVWFKIKGWF